jgi:hypothetical protein
MKQRSESPFFTQDQRKFIAADLKEKGLSEFQSEQFIITCERTLLDPFSRQSLRPGAVSQQGASGSGSDKWVVRVDHHYRHRRLAGGRRAQWRV